MKRWPTVASVAIHAAAVGALAWSFAPDAPPPGQIPVCFVVVEAAAPEAAPPAELFAQAVPHDAEEAPVPPEPPARGGCAEEAAPAIAAVLGEPAPPPESWPEPEPVRRPAPPARSEPPPPAPAPDAPAVAEAERSAIAVPPSALNTIAPVYPRSARRKGREGDVTLELSVTAEGTVSGVAVVATSGFADLDRAAVDAARAARFAPATEDSRPVEGRVRLSFEFKLK